MTFFMYGLSGNCVKNNRDVSLADSTRFKPIWDLMSNRRDDSLYVPGSPSNIFIKIDSLVANLPSLYSSTALLNWRSINWD